ncbi:MAG TPA: MarR family transcriptional regulator [Anaerolineaceae bacterium]|jgi:MarR family transcriptional regulator, organic hydroperoxide resistance regulator
MHDSNENETLDFLLAQVSHLHHSRVYQLLEKLGLYRGQPPLLFALWEKEGLTQTELARQLHDSPATITKMLQRMEKTGFIARRPDEVDQRVSRVYLTDAGRAVKTDLEEVWATMDRDTFKGFSLDERVLLRRLFCQLRSNLQSAVNGRMEI